MTGTDDAAGRVIAGRYRLQRKLGAGGMGRVWSAHDQELVCDVALKEIFVPPDTPKKELEGRIARARVEARHTARLRSNPHVVTVYDVIEDGGLPWIVMENVPGARDLGEVVREGGPLSPVACARIGLAVLDALSAGHQLGIVHRDVKPANILLTGSVTNHSAAEDVGRVMLADYGISLQQDSDEPRLTSPSGIIGTPQYIAPERAHGSPPTAASDMFSLGATLYFAVEGQGPFSRDTDVATLTALLFEEPALPRRAAGLTPTLLGLLSKDPGQRLSGDAAIHQLAQFGTEARPPSSQRPHAPTVRVSPTPDQPPTQEAPSTPQQQPSLSPPTARETGEHRAEQTLKTHLDGFGAPTRRLPPKARWGIAMVGAATLLAGVLLWVTLSSQEPPQGLSADAESPAPSRSDSSDTVNDWAKRFCDQAQPQWQKISDANEAIRQQSTEDSTPEAVQKADSQAFQQISAAYKALGAALQSSGAPPVKEGATTQQNTVKAYENTATSYANLKKQTDELDVADQAKFADGLKDIAQQLDKIDTSVNAAQQKLNSGETGEAMAAQPGCQ
ncbi:protein kinase domain-containing protein [Streptomyces sp. NPDC054849]